MTTKHKIEERINKSISVKKSLLENEKLIVDISKAADAICRNMSNGGKVILAGNGGSFADAQHLCAEFVSRLIVDRDPLPAIALGVNGSNFSAIGNDYGFEHVFSRELKSLYRENDIFIGISTSGKSPNIINALDTATELGCLAILLTGEKVIFPDSSILEINVPCAETMHIQESHIMIGHILCEAVEHYFYGDRI